MESVTDIPWDQRLARVLVKPLVGTWVRPNHLTALSLLAALGAAALFALGSETAADWAAALFMLAVFIDHTDGELARLTGTTSRFGHYFDYAVGSSNYTLLFVSLGVGLAQGPMGNYALALGLAAGLSNPVIVTLRLTMEKRYGKKAVAHPRFAAFELEDFIYLIGPIIWLGGLEYFFLIYGLGTLGYLGWTAWGFLRLRGRRAE
ncbi:MAG: CDP-alcohol phosphatidyltransferase family protein [Alphaproteobacteria bacterium]